MYVTEAKACGTTVSGACAIVTVFVAVPEKFPLPVTVTVYVPASLTVAEAPSFVTVTVHSLSVIVCEAPFSATCTVSCLFFAL